MKTQIRSLLRQSQLPIPRPVGLSPRHLCRWQSTVGSDGREWSTPLARSLGEAITTTGPIPLASYMRQCLTSPEGGYYTRRTTQGTDQFGAKGDFITSPEISQVFGELIGLWIVAEWLAQGKPWGTHIIELGPGRGTLMSDVLRTVANFKEFKESLTDVVMVEASSYLREAQHKLLCGENELEDRCRTNEPGWWKSTTTQKLGGGKKIEWYEELRYVPKNEMAAPFVIAHEFFDALPIHAFQSAPSDRPGLTTSVGQANTRPKQNEWRELLVTPASPTSSLISPSTQAQDKLGVSKSFTDNSSNEEFTLIASKIPTAHSNYLPTTSDRYKTLLRLKNATIEISPESQTIMAEIAQRIGGSNTSAHKRSGAALIVDYGPLDTIPANSLRGIRAHKLVSPFVSPGQVDLSADVDFLALAETALEASPGVEVHGPVEQASFLGGMGIVERTRVLTENAGKRGDAETARRIEEAMTRLIDRGARGMGKVYKAMAVLPYKEEAPVRRPVGFGGDVSS